MKTAITAYLSSLVAMLALDSVWLSLSASRLYRPAMGALLLPDFHLAPAAAFYLLYAFGIVVLVVLPALAKGRIGRATGHGALLGLVAYATYDLTNQATLRGWPMTVTVADMCWGTFLTRFAATAAYALTRRIAPPIG
jgi:uncharacterized membrane protein